MNHWHWVCFIHTYLVSLCHESRCVEHIEFSVWGNTEAVRMGPRFQSRLDLTQKSLIKRATLSYNLIPPELQEKSQCTLYWRQYTFSRSDLTNKLIVCKSQNVGGIMHILLRLILVVIYCGWRNWNTTKCGYSLNLLLPFLSLSASLKCQFGTDTHSLAFKHFFNFCFLGKYAAILYLYWFSNQLLDTRIIRGALNVARVGNHFLQTSAVRLKNIVYDSV